MKPQARAIPSLRVENPKRPDSVAEREGIRTLGTGYPVRQISNLLPAREHLEPSKTL